MKPTATTNKTFEQNYIDNKATLKSLYENYLLTGYDGLPFREFIVLQYAEMQNSPMYQQDKTVVKEFIAHIKDLTVKTERQRLCIRVIDPKDWRKEHYVALIMINRNMIKKYRAIIKRITDKY